MGNPRWTAYGATARIEYKRNYPITVNHARETEFAVKSASEIAGPGKVIADIPPIMAGEDFALMLEARPGNMIFIALLPGSKLATRSSCAMNG